MDVHHLKKELDKRAAYYEHQGFISTDPISIPHRFSLKKDIEIAAFFAAILAWGNRNSIIKSCNNLLQMMDNSPYHFVKNYNEKELKPFLQFKHRTFNGIDAIYFLQFLKHHYSQSTSLETAFCSHLPKKAIDVSEALNGFYHYFFTLPHYPTRTQKHIASPDKGSACKRLNMFLRWMVRPNTLGVDFGIWKNIKPSQLICPLDVHSGRVARQLGLLHRKQNDWKAAQELTQNLRLLDITDPVKYDFALFGSGVNHDDYKV